MEPLAAVEFGAQIREVCRVYAVDQAVGVVLVEDLNAAREESVSDEEEYPFSLALLKFLRDVDNRFALREDVVDNDNVLVRDVAADEFVSDNRVAAVDELAVVSYLVENAEIELED